MLALAAGPTAHAVQAVLQRGYDAGVDGANLAEVTLNTSNVSPATFGLVFKLAVDDVVFAQPLYVPNLVIPGRGTHNVVYVATMSDTLFAFDADSGVQLWSVNFASSVGAAPVPYAKFAFAGNRNIVGNLGILSTPVIDPSTNTIYLVACTLESSAMVYRLHAANITTGAELIVTGGTVISASYKGSTFVASGQTQRVSLALSGNQVLFGFAAMEEEASDIGGYVGWVMAYNKTTLVQSGVFATVTTGTRGGGVWQSGRPPAVDSSGYVYAFVGNGYSSGYDGVNNFNESALKLNPATGLNLVDWFTPSIWSAMDANDEDLTSSGPMLIPGTSLLAGGGKTGILYVLNTANLGKESATDSGAVQKETVSAGEIHGGPVYWQRSAANGGPLLYDWGASDPLKAYPFNGTTIAATPSSQGSSTPVWPGGILALSANGDTPGSGVLWATAATSGDAENNPPVPGALYAFDANNVATELWDSTMNSSRDNVGLFAKFVPPLVANGKVYVATWSDQVAVYGLLSTYTVSPTSLSFGNQLTNIASAPKSVTVTNTGTVALSITSITLSTPSPLPFSQTNTCGTSVAIGASCTISVLFDPASAGATTATLSVNAGNGAGTQSMALSGTGIVPTYTVSPTSLAFSNQLTNIASAPMSVTVTNTGTVVLPITSITLSTPSPQPYSQTNTCGTSVAVGATCTINVLFDPATVGAAAATLRLNGAGSTSIVNLSGSGGFNVALTASSPSVTVGMPVTLTWSSTPGASCTASGGATGDNWTGTFAASGTQLVTETSTGVYDYGLNCLAQAIAAAATVTVTATATIPLPTVSLAAAPTSITVGNPVALTWTSSHAATCVAGGGQSGDGWAGIQSVNGTASITPNAAGTIVYTITCSSVAGSVQSTAQVAATSPASSSGTSPPSTGGSSASSTGGGSPSSTGGSTSPPSTSGTSSPNSSSGGGAIDAISLLSLLIVIALRRGKRPSSPDRM
jgi:hypothetical protein